MTKDEFAKLKAGCTVWLALPMLSRPMKGKTVFACLADVSSKAMYGVEILRRNVWFRWVPRSDREFLKCVSLKEDVDEV